MYMVSETRVLIVKIRYFCIRDDKELVLLSELILYIDYFILLISF